MLSAVFLSAVMPSAVMQSNVILSVNMLSVTLLKVMAPFNLLELIENDRNEVKMKQSVTRRKRLTKTFLHFVVLLENKLLLKYIF
jgi:hypothetical protein